MGLFGGYGVNGSSVAACSKQMHTQLTQRQHVLKVVHQLKKVGVHPLPAWVSSNTSHSLVCNIQQQRQCQKGNKTTLHVRCLFLPVLLHTF